MRFLHNSALILTGVFFLGADKPAPPPDARDSSPTTAIPATRPAGDGWSGEYHRLGGFDHKTGTTRVTIEKFADAYRLKGTGIYDNYDFVEEKPGLLWDRKHILGTITRGTITHETGGRTGELPPQTVLNAQFCYEYFLLLGGAAPATQPAK
jgi:hypothetical protein